MGGESSTLKFGIHVFFKNNFIRTQEPVFYPAIFMCEIIDLVGGFTWESNLEPKIRLKMSSLAAIFTTCGNREFNFESQVF